MPAPEVTGATQLLVRDTMLRAGGYWRPLAAVARLLEELGELAELLGSDTPEPAELRFELADLWIITTALGDQFLAVVQEPASRPGEGETWSATAGVFAAGGQIARVVNHYDGPKVPREGSELPSLAAALGSFHAALSELAGVLGVDLASAVADKLRLIAAGSDMARFALDRSDPATAPSVQSFAAAGSALRGQGARLPTRVWGAPTLPASSTAEMARLIGPSLLSFAKAADREGLEAYVVAAPPLAESLRASWMADLLAELGALEELAGVMLSATLLGDPGQPAGGFFLLLAPLSGR